MKLNVAFVVLMVSAGVFLAAPAPAQVYDCVRTDTPQGYRVDCTELEPEPEPEPEPPEPQPPDCIRTDTPQGYRLDCTEAGPSTPQPEPQQRPEMGIVISGGWVPIVFYYGGISVNAPRNAYLEGRTNRYGRLEPYGGVTFLQGGGRPALSLGVQYRLGAADSMIRIAPRIGIWYRYGTAFTIGGAAVEFGRKVGVGGGWEFTRQEGSVLSVFRAGGYFRF